MSTPGRSEEALAEARLLLCRRILQAVGVLHDKDASVLAQKTLEQLSQDDPERLEALRREWVEFLASYDDAFLKKLSAFGAIDPGDLRRSIEKIDLFDMPDPAFYRRIARLLTASLSPSIASGVDDELGSFAKMLEEDPGFLRSEALQEEFLRALKRRQELDRRKYSELLFGFKEPVSAADEAVPADAMERALELAEEAFVQQEENYLLALFDVDHYRSLQDAFGEKSAEGIMMTLEKIIDASAPGASRRGRSGEGRIMLLCLDADLPSLSAWTQQVTRALQERCFVTRGEHLRVSASAALLERKGSAALADLLHSLKRELYERKRKGWQ